MATTAQQILTYVNEAYPDFPAAAPAAQGLRLLQEVHNQLCRFVKLYQEEQFDLTALVAGTYEYALDDSILRIWAATYYSSAAAYTPMVETSQDELDTETKSWRDYPKGLPTRYYDMGSVVGISPPPLTATASGYPFIRLYVTKQHTLVLASNMPQQAPDYDAWIAGVCERWAFRNDRAQYPNWVKIARMKREDLASFVMGRQIRNKPHAEFNAPRPVSL